MGEIKNIVIVDIDSTRGKSPIIVGHPADQILSENKEWQIVDDMAVLCEGLCCLIHSAEMMGLKKSSDSLRDCMEHIQLGFADATYKTKYLNADETP